MHPVHRRRACKVKGYEGSPGTKHSVHQSYLARMGFDLQEWKWAVCILEPNPSP